MKVILLQNIARVGQKYEVKDVPDGHALNYLIPRKMAELATKKSLKRLEDIKGKQASSVEAEVQSFKKAIETLQATPVSIAVAANEKGHLFKGMKAEDIAEAVTANGTKFSAEYIDLDAPIKELGTHEVSVHLGDEKDVFTLELVAEK